MLGLQKVVDESKIGPKLLEIVKIRASQINGGAYCLDMHTKDAIAIGENEQRLHVLQCGEKYRLIRNVREPRLHGANL